MNSANQQSGDAQAPSQSTKAPDAMNQTISQMVMAPTSTSSTASHAAISNQISSLYKGTNTRPQYTINTGIPPQAQYMAYPVPWRATSGPDYLPPDFGWLSESCAGKAAIGVLAGSVCGLVMGVFLGAMSDMTPPVTIINGKEVPQAPLREQMRTTLRATGEKSLYWARNFAFITGVFGGTDCLVEKYRGTHDVWNSVLSGCVTGAAMQAKQGPQAAAIGCGGFAAFSLVIDKVMGTH
jgi:import inner membrane translocase subunit TIM22